MSFNISKALSAYDRQDTVEVQCADEWFVTVRPFSSAVKALTKAQANIRSKSVTDKRQVASTSMSLINPSLAAIEDKNPWMLGSKEADIRFFVEHIVSNWRGLFDDNGNEVPFSVDAAMHVFSNHGDPGLQLYRELLASSLDTSLFVKTLECQTEEDAKN